MHFTLLNIDLLDNLNVFFVDCKNIYLIATLARLVNFIIGDSIKSETNNENVESKSTFDKDCNVDNSDENACPEKDFNVEENAEKSSNQGSFKTRNKKKYLQRRLSGGTEIFQAGAAQNDKNENSDEAQTESSSCDNDDENKKRVGIKRRNSFPSEAFTKTGTDLFYFLHL